MVEEKVNLNYRKKIIMAKEMIELLFWSLIVVTWLAVGIHVAKEFVRFANRGDNQN